VSAATHKNGYDPTIGRYIRFPKFSGSKPVDALEFTDNTVDLSRAREIEGEPIHDCRTYGEHLDRAGRPYRLGVVAYRVRTVDHGGKVRGPSRPSFMIPFSPEYFFSRDDDQTCRLEVTFPRRCTRRRVNAVRELLWSRRRTRRTTQLVAYW
jgi:hypothetical protein